MGANGSAGDGSAAAAAGAGPRGGGRGRPPAGRRRTPAGRRRWTRFVVVLAAVALAGTAALVAWPRPRPMTAVERALAARVDLDLENVSAETALARLAAAQPDLGLVIDRLVVGRDEALLERPVTIMAKGLRVETALRLILGSRLALKVEPARVVVTTPDQVVADLVTEAHDVGRILKRLRSAPQFRDPRPFWERLKAWWEDLHPYDPAPNVLGAAYQGRALFRFREAESALEGLVSLIQRTVNAISSPRVAPWWDEGGDGLAEPVGGVLLVRQTAEAHEEIARLLTALRRGLAAAGNLDRGLSLPGRIDVRPEPPETAEVRRRLARPVDAVFEGVPLDKVLDFLGEALGGVPIVVQPDGRHRDRPPFVVPVHLRATGVPAETVRLLKSPVEVRFEQMLVDDALVRLAAARPGLNLAPDWIHWSGYDQPLRRATWTGGPASVETILGAVLDERLAYGVLPGLVLVGPREHAHVRLYLGCYPVADLLPAMPDPPPTAPDPSPTPVQTGPGGPSEHELRLQDWRRRVAPLVRQLAGEAASQEDPGVARWFLADAGPAQARVVGGILVVTQTPRGHEKVLEYLNRLRAERRAQRR